MRVINVKRYPVCVTCKNWYDPACSAMKPKAPAIDLWEIDDTCRKMCSIKNFETNGGVTCPKYVSKL